MLLGTDLPTRRNECALYRKILVLGPLCGTLDKGMSTETESSTRARAVFANRAFALFTCARSLTVIASEMQAVAVGWQLYDITKRPLDLGLAGLAQFVPSIVLFLLVGHTADRYSRRNILLWCFGGFVLCSGLLFASSMRAVPSVAHIYSVVVLIGVVRAFSQPAQQSLLPQLVTEEVFPSAVAWAQSIQRVAMITGPALGGVVYAATRGAAAVYASSAIACALAVIAMIGVQTLTKVPERRDASMKTLLAGLAYTWRQKILLGSISLDLFAVLLGGATALLPVYAKDILHTGPWGLGVLRSAPSLGGLLTAVLIARTPVRRRAGATMLWCVAGFGLATVVFGLSQNLLLSVVALFVLGSTDMVSVVLRHTLIQLSTPDEMRGRVAAINSLAVGASNEVGQFESGVTAQWFGTVPAVVLGGIGTLAIVALWARWFPEIRCADELRAPVVAEQPASD